MDIELGVGRRLGDDSLSSDIPSTEVKIDTAFGNVEVHIVGDRKRPAMLTFHDLGQNSNSCFQSFFQFSDMATITERFCVYHVNAPGQEDDAVAFATDFVYPTMDDLADIVGAIVDHFSLKSVVLFGVGMGANVLARFALKRPRVAEALIAVNCVVTQAGWLEWGYQKFNVNYLWKGRMTNFTVGYLMWHHFGKHWDEYKETDLVADYYQYFCNLSHPLNLALLIDAYIRRTNIDISRTGTTLECPVLQIVGIDSPFLNETVDFNAKLDPAKSNYIKISDCSGLVLDDKPDKVAEAILLFLQGHGHLVNVNHVNWVRRKSSSLSGASSSPRGSQGSVQLPKSPERINGATSHDELGTERTLLCLLS